jgi:hypothetical protein
MNGVGVWCLCVVFVKLHLCCFSSVSLFPPQVLSVLQDDFVPNRRKGSVRRLFIRRDIELRQVGFTDACPGCEAAAKKADAVGHSDGCRFRVESALARRGGGMRLELVKEKLASGAHPRKRGRKHLEVKTAQGTKRRVCLRAVDLRRFGSYRPSANGGGPTGEA